MTIELGTFGAWRSLRDMDLDTARLIEDLGYGAIWIGGSPPGDLEAIEDVIAATRAIPVVTGIVNMWRVGASELAGSYERIESRHPGRFVLGVGIGHPESTDEYRSPLHKITTYLDELASAGVPSERLVLAALGPRVLQIAGRRTAGAHPYLTTPRHTAMARQLMGPGPLLAPEQKVTLANEAGAARSIGRDTVTRYLRLTNYRANLVREGWDPADLLDGGSDRLIDELVLHGQPETVAAGIQAHVDAGADHVCIQVLGPDPQHGYRTLAKHLL